jgi:hypothetical protein
MALVDCVEQCSPAVAIVLRVRIGAADEQSPRGVHGARARGPHERGHAVRVALVCGVPLPQQLLNGAGRVARGDDGERQNRAAAARRCREGREAEAGNEHEMAHDAS